jgi:sugar (pentulose or hexulose) kinase
VRVAGLDVGGSAVKAWLWHDGAVRTSESALPVLRPAPHRVELDLAVLESACRAVLRDVVDRPVDAVTVSSMRQAFALLDADGLPLGPAVLNGDRRGAPHAQVLAGTHDLTGHWPAPELTLPKLLAVRADEPERWAATRRVLFVHDWLLWRLTGEQVTEASYACAGGMADVAARTWATGLLEACGVGTDRLAPVVEAGTVVGTVRGRWPVGEGTPVLAGCGDTQLAAVGTGGLADGVVTVVAGSSTPVIAASAQPVRDPLSRPWVSTHAAPDRWAAEGNAGYPGTASGWWAGLAPSQGDALVPSPVVAVTAAPWWSEQTWSVKPPTSLVGLGAATTADDVRAALLQAHAFAVRGNVGDLERALGRTASAVVVTGGAARDGVLPRLVAAVLGREVRHGRDGAGAGGAWLAARALGGAAEPALPDDVVPAGDPGPWEEPYGRWLATTEALRAALPE